MKFKELCDKIVAIWPNWVTGQVGPWSGRWPRTQRPLSSFGSPLQRWENLPEGPRSQQHVIRRKPLLVYDSLFLVCQTAFKGLAEHEEKDSLVLWDKKWTIWAKLQSICLADTRPCSSHGSCPPFSEPWWWDAVMLSSRSRDREAGQNRGMDECSRMQRGHWRKPAPESMQPQAAATVHLSAGQWPK